MKRLGSPESQELLVSLVFWPYGTGGNEVPGPTTIQALTCLHSVKSLSRGEPGAT